MCYKKALILFLFRRGGEGARTPPGLQKELACVYIPLFSLLFPDPFGAGRQRFSFR